MEKQCNYKRSDVWQYVQNRMSREEETEFQRHLCTCDTCRKELEHWRGMVRSMEKKERRLMPRVWIIAATVACLIVGGGIYHYFAVDNEGVLVPGKPSILPVHPPVLRQGVDSMEKADTLPIDTCRIWMDD